MFKTKKPGSKTVQEILVSKLLVSKLLQELSIYYLTTVIHLPHLGIFLTSMSKPWLYPQINP